MESNAKLFGHPVHPMLIVVPLGLFSIGVLFDIVYVLTGTRGFAEVAFWNIGAGVAGGLLAAIFGLADWIGIPSGTRAKRIGLWHGAGNLVLVLLFTVSWVLRIDDPAYLPNLAPFLVGLVAVGISLVTAWLGGELVYRLRVAVDEGANLDAPNSLTSASAFDRGRPDRGGGSDA
jgi:uncharacterized membrane protein